MPVTLPDVELTCREGHRAQFHHHAIESPEPTGKRLFYPFGFPVEVRCDNKEVLRLYERMWGLFTPHFTAAPLICKVYVHSGRSPLCPPSPSYRIQGSLLATVADLDNYALVNLGTGKSRVTLSRSTLQHPLYASYFLLSAPLSALSSTRATPVHGACVSFNGRGVLLCGDSGAGKSTLAYACARQGWDYTSDDCSFVIMDALGCTIAGDCYHVRFRPESATLFPEINGLTVTPRAAGKPSVEMSTLEHNTLRLAPTARACFIIFLNRTGTDTPSIQPYSRDAARSYMQQSVIGTRSQRRGHMATIDHILRAPVLELRYGSLGPAIHLLQALMKERADVPFTAGE